MSIAPGAITRKLLSALPAEATVADRLVAAVLLSYAGTAGELWPKNQSVADLCGLTERMVRKIYHRLQEWGFLETIGPKFPTQITSPMQRLISIPGDNSVDDPEREELIEELRKVSKGRKRKEGGTVGPPRGELSDPPRGELSDPPILRSTKVEDSERRIEDDSDNLDAKKIASISSLRESGSEGPIDARTQLFREGVAIIIELIGLPPPRARAFIGKLLRDLRDDCPAALDMLRIAKEFRPADPTSWLIKASKARQKRRLTPLEEAARICGLFDEDVIEADEGSWLETLERRLG